MAIPVLIVGHKNPDNDSISAAVGYAYLKNELMKRTLEQRTTNTFLRVSVRCRRRAKRS